MLAERVPGLLPDLDLHDSLEVSAVHSLAGFNLADELITRPPYSDPHHSASVASIVGGGQRMARPGAISGAHKGVLFLDDSTEVQSIRLSATPAALIGPYCRGMPIGASIFGHRWPGARRDPVEMAGSFCLP
jgi:predicted ATPase with chaperone activity